MNAETLKLVFGINDLPTGSIQAVYTFESGSGCLLFNDLYTTGEQVRSGNVNHPIVETSPAISIACSSHVIDNLSTSSGLFTGADVFQVVEKIPTGEWTFFADYNEPMSTQGNMARVLVSTMDNYTGTSGFNFGLNASNRPYFEYIDSGNSRKILTHSKDVGINNLISVSQNVDTILITNHDIGSFEHESEEFELSNFVASDTLNIGNFPTGTNPNYVGFSGNMDSFILYKKSLAGDTQNIIAENYFYSGIQSGRTDQTLVSGLEVTGVDINLSGLTGTGITGYILNLYQTIETCLCGDINFYKNSGVSGDLFGQVVTYLTGSGYVTGVDLTEIASTRGVNYDKTLKYAEQGITFLDKVPEASVVELYSFTTFHPDMLNLQAPLVSAADFFTSTGYSEGNINVFGNGLAQYSGSEFTIVDGQLNSKNINFTNNNFSGSDTIIFDRISGDQNSVYTFSGFSVTGLDIVNSGSGYTSIPTVIFSGGENTAATAITGEADGTTKVTGLILTSGGSGHVTPPVITISGGEPSVTATAEASLNQNNYTLSTTDTNDLYLNGYKLLSGLDYTQTASEVVLVAPQVQNSQYNTGNAIFLPRISDNYIHFTGTANQFINTNIDLVEEQVWLNRKRAVLNEDYLRVSNVSLMKSPSFITGFNNTIYNNSNNFFNT
jgi:hypothetical protein